MADLKSELSKRNPYWINKHRYYELKHFCLQYPIWQKAVKALSTFPERYFGDTHVQIEFSDPTHRIAEQLAYYEDRIQMVDTAAREASTDIFKELVVGVTQGVPYDYLRTKYSIPYCRDKYYDLYRKFFWILNRLRQ